MAATGKGSTGGRRPRWLLLTLTIAPLLAAAGPATAPNGVDGRRVGAVVAPRITSVMLGVEQVAADAALGNTAAQDFNRPSASFDGIAFTGSAPPDPVGDVGPRHYVQAVNSSFRVFDKAGAALTAETPIRSLWTTAGDAGPCSRNGADPVVLYDHLADRWLVSQLGFAAGKAPVECIAVSQGADPVSGGWFVYTFAMPNGFEYPKLGVWPDAYYMSALSQTSTANVEAFALDRASMLRGGPATTQRFTLSNTTLVLLPSDLDGPPPPPGSPNVFARQVDGDVWGGADRIELFAFTVSWSDPARSSFTPLPALWVDPFDANLCAVGPSFEVNCVPQPGTSQKLAVLPHWAMMPLQYRSAASQDTMVFSHAVDVGADRVGVRWYELGRPPAGSWSVTEQGTYAPDDGLHRWMGSVARDRAGDIAIGYSVSGAHVFPGIRYAGRLAGDPLGALPRGENVLVDGARAQASDARWGDYSAMRVDPSDDCTFWYTNEYVAADGFWATRVGAFRFPECPAAVAPGFTPLTPARILDTRFGTGGISSKVGPGGSVNVPVTGVGGVPASGVGSVVMNVTVTEASAPSFLTVFPAGQSRPLASNINFVAGQDLANLAVAKVGPGGGVTVYNNAGSVHVIFDVVGWYGG